MKITYSRILDKYSVLKPTIYLIQEKFFIQYIFNAMEPYKLQQGMTTKTINGIDITYDQSAIREFQKKLNAEIDMLILNIRGFGFDDEATSVQMYKRYKR